MSQLTIVNKSQLVAAAAAMSTMGFLTLAPPARAHPILPLAPACSQYVFNGDFPFEVHNLGVVSFNSTGPAASGTLDSPNSGSVTGGISGRDVDFTINWGGPAEIHSEYAGTVGADGLVHNGRELGTSFSWDSKRPLGCQLPQLSGPVTQVPNRRTVPPLAPLTTSTSTP